MTSAGPTQIAGATSRSRLTENKRRYRARRKEYVADLERRLAEARAQGVKATKEVQSAARKVAAENGRLRELLRLAGFADKDIDGWATGDSRDCTRRGEIEQKARLCAAILASPEGLAAEEKTCPSRKNIRQRESRAAGAMPRNTDTALSIQEPLAESGSSESHDSDPTVTAGPTPPTSEAATRTGTCAARGREIRPCKLLSLLAENPSADITQVPVHPRAADPLHDTAQREGDVECGKAYEMLMQYATSEEKMDYVARALEAGCTANGKGGCAVKKKVVWEALDSMCE
ncbi:hypothetical protein N657DRAFT_499685 [Parathielavia appendiculata]|uniref:BZIP domain-containing protein n=1 Tax=Parathielavia appendiculata TaxID=2587402 RepID=A0AAN6Z1P8_9PEZI|nr:hypothetical protein N657DRAFT_499685 [Parathielavia appendiculata]